MPFGVPGVRNFLGLTDTPNTYAGSGGYTVKVNAGATALEFSAAAALQSGPDYAAGSGSTDTWGMAAIYTEDTLAFAGFTYPSANVQNLKWNGNLFVGTGTPLAAFNYSYNGTIWIPCTTAGLVGGGYNTLAWNGAVWASVNGSGFNNAATSADGITWTAQLAPGGGVACADHGLIAHGNTFVLTQNLATTVYYTSTDGFNWTARNFPGALPAGTWKTCASNGAVTVAIQGNVMSSVAAYTPTPAIEASWIQTAMPSGHDWNKVIWTGKVFFAKCNDDPTVGAISADGITWIPITMPAVAGTYGFAAANAIGTILVASGWGVGSTDLITSTDNGATWITRTASAALNWHAVASDGAKFVCIENNGLGVTVSAGANMLAEGVYYGARLSLTGRADIGGNARIGGTLTVNGNFTIGTGGVLNAQATTGHVIGGTAVPGIGLRLEGAIAGVGGINRGLSCAHNLSPALNNNAAIAVIGGNINLNGAAGVHPIFSGLVAEAPTITAGVSTVTNAASLRIPGAPVGAVNNYAFWTQAGDSRFDNAAALGGGAPALLGTTGGAGPAVAAQNEWLRIVINGNVRFLPAWA